MSIEELRKQIDKVNFDILTLIRERVDIARKIAHEKKQSHRDLLDAKREAAMDDLIAKASQELALEKEFILDIFHLIVEYTRHEMKKEMEP